MTGKVRVNVSLRRVRVTIVVVEKEEELKKPVGVSVACMGTCIFVCGLLRLHKIFPHHPIKDNIQSYNVACCFVWV